MQNPLLGSHTNLNRLESQEPSYHICTLVCSLLFVGIMITVIILAGSSISAVAATIIAIVTYLIYLCVVLPCNTLYQYLSNVEEGYEFAQEYEKGRNVQGEFVLKIECYHYEEDFDTDIRNSRERRKVTTHTADRVITPSLTIDQSGPIQFVNTDKNIIFIESQVDYRFADPISEQNFHQQVDSFKRTNTQDDHADFDWSYQVKDLRRHVMFQVGEHHCHFKTALILASVFLMAWPYSMWVQSKIDRFHITYRKVVTISEDYVY